MKRFIGALASVAVVVLTTAGVAQAAAAPTVTTKAAGKITQSSAFLYAKVNPNGQATNYSFNYGATASYGSVAGTVSAGTGKQAVVVQDEVTGLLPGTVYHFQVTATNASGTTTGGDLTFTTTGPAPAGVATGGLSALGKTTATLTGSVTPGTAPTDWYVQYGPTTNYGLNTDGQALAAGTAAVPVSAALVGLAPATLFHYRVVAYHPSDGFYSYGDDGTFFTYPDHPPAAGMTTKTTPASLKKAPYTFTTTGTLKGGTYIPSTARCTGTAAIRYYNGKHQLGATVVNVGSNCTFQGSVAFKKLHEKTKGRVRLRITIYYRGNGYLAAESKTDHVWAGAAVTK